MNVIHDIIHDVSLFSHVYDLGNLVVSLVALIMMASSSPNVGIRGISWSFVVINDTGAIAGECGLPTKPAKMREHPWKLGVLASG
jgi:hypothetical protein